MSIRPFSPSEIANIRQAIEKNGWKIEGLIENYFRYSVRDNKIIIFTIKIPIGLPVRLNIPFEIVNFKISIAFRIWNLNQNTTKFLLYFMKMLRDLALQISLEHNIPIEGKEKQLTKLLNLLIPDLLKNENDCSWLNRIRVSLLNKRTQFEEFDMVKIKDIVEILERKAGLEPSFKQPWELNKGIPKIRTSETLFFSNDEPFDEFFMLERGYFTFFKDLDFNRIYIRTFFESYTPYIINQLFKDNADLKMEVFIENWIKFSRLILNSIIEIIEGGDINQSELISINPEKDLDTLDFELEENNFPFSSLHYESVISKELYPIHNDLLNTPPVNFEVLETIKNYTQAEELIKNYNFEEATQFLNESLKVFNKNRQKKVVVAVLLKLRKISSLLNQDNISINYLKNGLAVAKTGEVPIEQIIIIHYYLGKTYFRLRQFDLALNHFQVIINFLEGEKIEIKNRIDYLGISHLYIGLIQLDKKNHSDSKNSMKKAFQLSTESLKVKLKYSYLRAKYYKNEGNLSQTQKLLKLGLDAVGLDFNEIDAKHHKIIIDIMLELAEFYIHFRKESKRASNLLTKISEQIDIKDIRGMKKAIRWNLLMADFYHYILNERDKYQYYLKESRQLKVKLQSFGVIE
jgi:hypothetical protein